MRSKVAETVREEASRRDAALTPAVRLAEMLRLGEEQLRTYMAAHRLSRDEAMARIEHADQAGRRPSRCLEQVIDESRRPDTRRPR